MEKRFLSSKFYPVDYDANTIYDMPADRERDCNFIDQPALKGTKAIGIKGARLNKHACYSTFQVQQRPA